MFQRRNGLRGEATQILCPRMFHSLSLRMLGIQAFQMSLLISMNSTVGDVNDATPAKLTRLSVLVRTLIMNRHKRT